MKVSDLIEKLKKFPQDVEVRIMNVAIEDDESCPTFELKQIEKASDVDNFDKDTDVEFVFLQFLDDDYVDDVFLSF